MKYRKLGNTGLVVSEISFGTIPVLKGSVPVLPKYYNLENDEAVSLMRDAWDMGCNFYDTAIVPEYGDAEIKLGMFAKTVDREKLIISDKARAFDGNEMYLAVEKSIENLGEIPDIYFAHQVDYKNADEVFEKYGALDALAELKAEGKIRYAGIASHYYDILYRGACDGRVDVLQGSGNIIECGMLDRIKGEQKFLEKGLVINKVYAAGLLPSYFSEQELIGGVLAYPVSTALIGIGTKEQAETAFLHYDHPGGEQNKVRKKWFLPIDCDRCQKCYCVEGTEIHTIFRQYNYYYMGKDHWALKKLDLGIRESAARCAECTDLSCVKQCPRGLFIPEIMRRVHKLVEDHLH